MNVSQQQRSKHKHFPWAFWVAFSIVILITLALIGVIIWLVRTQDLDKLSTKLGILASVVTALVGPLTLFFTILKWPDSESADEHNSSQPLRGGIQAETITHTANVVSGTQIIGTQIIQEMTNPSQHQTTPTHRRWGHLWHWLWRGLCLLWSLIILGVVVNILSTRLTSNKDFPPDSPVGLALQDLPFTIALGIILLLLTVLLWVMKHQSAASSSQASSPLPLPPQQVGAEFTPRVHQETHRLAARGSDDGLEITRTD